MDKHDITILYHLHSVDLAYHEKNRAKVGKSGIIQVNSLKFRLWCKENNKRESIQCIDLKQ